MMREASNQPDRQTTIYDFLKLFSSVPIIPNGCLDAYEVKVNKDTF